MTRNQLLAFIVLDNPQESIFDMQVCGVGYVCTAAVMVGVLILVSMVLVRLCPSQVAAQRFQDTWTRSLSHTTLC